MDYELPRLAADCPKVSKLKFIECIVRVLALLLLLLFVYLGMNL